MDRNVDGLVPYRTKCDPGLSVLLTVGEVAKLLRVSHARVYALVERGELPAGRVFNAIRVRWADLYGLRPG